MTGTWLLRREDLPPAPELHHCSPPWDGHRNNLGFSDEQPLGVLGDVWRCDKCGRHWLQVVHDDYLAWTRITARTARRLIRRAINERGGVR